MTLYTYRATLVRVVDGDTFDLTVDVGFRHTLTDRFRLHGGDTWEPRGDTRAMGHAATAATEYWFSQAVDGTVVINTFRAREKYGRWLAAPFHTHPTPGVRSLLLDHLRDGFHLKP